MTDTTMSNQPADKQKLGWSKAGFGGGVVIATNLAAPFVLAWLVQAMPNVDQKTIIEAMNWAQGFLIAGTVGVTPHDITKRFFAWGREWIATIRDGVQSWIDEFKKRRGNPNP